MDLSGICYSLLEKRSNGKKRKEKGGEKRIILKGADSEKL